METVKSFSFPCKTITSHSPVQISVSFANNSDLRNVTQDGKTIQGDLGTIEAESSWIANKL